MFTAFVMIVVVTALANGWAAAADLARLRFVLANMTEVGVPQSWLPMLALLKAAAAVGLVLGLLGVRTLGIAAGVGLVLFFAAALAVHVRARAFHNIAFPGGYFALATASVVLAVAAR